MGNCIYCGTKAGWFRNVHAHCQEQRAAELLELMNQGRFKDAAVAAEEIVVTDKSLSGVGNFALSTIYFTAMCNAKPTDPFNADILKVLFHGMEERIGSMNPTLYNSLYKEPSQEELDQEAHMRGCTLEALGCSYLYARRKAFKHTQDVQISVKKYSPDWRGANERLTVIGMMDEMYGIAGDDQEPIVPGLLEGSWGVRHETTKPQITESDILEEMTQLKETSTILMSGSIGTRITGAEATVLIRKKTAGLVGGSRRVFSVSDDANEADIKRWLEDPRMTGLTDTFVVNVAAHSQVSTKMMKDILSRLLQDEYQRLYKIAEEKVKQRQRL